MCGCALNNEVYNNSVLFLCTSQFQNCPFPPPRAIPGHLNHVKLRKAGNLIQNEARPKGHLTFVSKRLSAVGSKRISQFFDSAHEPRSRVIALVDSTLACEYSCPSSLPAQVVFCDATRAGNVEGRLFSQANSTWVFLLLSFYIVISWNMPLFKVWSEDKLNKKFVMAENFAELLSAAALTCLEGGGFDHL